MLTYLDLQPRHCIVILLSEGKPIVKEVEKKLEKKQRETNATSIFVVLEPTGGYEQKFAHFAYGLESMLDRLEDLKGMLAQEQNRLEAQQNRVPCHGIASKNLQDNIASLEQQIKALDKAVKEHMKHILSQA